ncbi:Gfo/Idh/MocA family protein [Paenibacillus bovis]|uniref:Oxidoreductase n=1 Tax=Paenibacillus bovis TaxID=1616788 RepID=A0A172ZF16_9BACL|nr:Gfo/Idh/MocA family oxidoreductase [Paenibacillus bovis]ANF96093.1 oxidoreductase [Paenibacillus bovis]
MVRFGIIGTNFITERFIEAAKRNDDFELTALYSRTPERAQQFGRKHEIAHLFTDLEEMLGSGQVDAVYIASPNSLHAEQAVLCMDHGKHVLCEKPLASNVAETQAIIDAAKRNNVVLMEAMKSTMMPNFEALRSSLPKLGQVRRYFSNYCQYSSRYDAYKEGNIQNAFKPEFSNGALMDLGVYCIYPLVALFGRPNTVKATGVMLESGVDGEGSIVVSYDDMDAVVMYSKITDSSLPSEIQGELGSIRIDKISEPNQIVMTYRGGYTEELHVTQYEPPMYYEIREFLDLIAEGRQESSINSWEHSLITAEIMEEARKQLGLIYPADRK